MTPNNRDQQAGPLATDDEEVLGTALGRAIGARVDATAPPAPPSRAAIADRAAARARVQTAQRTVVAVAASVLVMVGGVVGWNALNRQDTTTVFVTSEQVLEPSTGTVPVTGEPEPDDSFPDDVQEFGIPTPGDLSTGPVLEWAEVDPGFVDLIPFQSTGDGRVIAFVWPKGEEQVLHSEWMVVTDNGTDWEELPLPDGLIPEQIDITGDRWLVVGRYRDFDAPEGRLNRVFFSDDQGTTWIELEFEIPPDPALASPYLQEHLWVSPALVSAERMVLVLQGYTSVDAQSLLADRGLLPEGKEVLRWEDDGPGTVAFDLHDPFETDPDSPDFATQHLEVTFKQLGLTEYEWAKLSGPQEDMARILYSYGSTVEFVGRYTGDVLMGSATLDGFVLTLLDGSNETILTSPDGLLWTEEPSFEYGYSPRVVTAGGMTWRSVPEPRGSLEIQRASFGEAPETTATFDGLHPSGVPAVGLAGVAITAFPSLGGQLEEGAIGGLPMWRDPDRMSDNTGVPLWFGWSADGTEWGWQTLPDALGITEGEPSAQLAVGRDFVIVRVETYGGSTSEEAAAPRQDPDPDEDNLDADAPAARWFIARVPQ